MIRMVPDEDLAEYHAWRKAAKVWRTFAELTQDEVADKLGVSKSTISELERGSRKRIPPRSMIEDMEKLYHVPNHELLRAAGYIQEQPEDELEEKVRDILRRLLGNQ